MILQKNIYVGMAAYLNQKKQRASLHVDMHARRSKCPNLRSNKQIENLMFGQILLSVSLTVTTSSIWISKFLWNNYSTDGVF